MEAPCLFATHFHELTALKGPGGVANFHVDARIDEGSRKVGCSYTCRSRLLLVKGGGQATLYLASLRVSA